MGIVSVPCRSQLSSTIGNEYAVCMPGDMLPAGAREMAGGVNLLRREYLPTPERRGRNAAHASSTRAEAPRTISCEARAFQLVAPARAPTESDVIPPGCARTSSVGTGSGAVSSAVTVAAAAGGGGVVGGTDSCARAAWAPSHKEVPKSTATPPEPILVRIIAILSIAFY